MSAVFGADTYILSREDSDRRELTASSCRYKEEGFAIAQVKAQVAELFAGHDDLLGEFGNFLPDPANRAAPVQKQVMSDC